MEYYVALRDATDAGDDSAASALMELQPYAVIGAEQAIERQDFAEAERLRRLVAAADPRAPSLARMASAITKGLFDQSRESRESQAALDEVATANVVAPAITPTAPPAMAPPVPVAAPTSSPTAMVPAAVAAATPVDSRASATAAIRPPATSAVAAPARTELVALRTPAPEYPDERRGRRAVGQVVASFTVNSDGTVGGIRTESVGTRHPAFERSVARTLSRWKYQPPGESRDVTMSFNFAP
ncbi:MAG: hypothetical protein A3E01_05905 [Gammaproteobacteria bacterium RIFCSPHIGHO2_12_FULL_63_22]|nr:MAG: hypothetical protein A3E01_05905 [Gammaproteobacteria bacterium RIFCSPHIGHO2_12_FULL_63_22]